MKLIKENFDKFTTKVRDEFVSLKSKGLSGIVKEINTTPRKVATGLAILFILLGAILLTKSIYNRFKGNRTLS